MPPTALRHAAFLGTVAALAGCGPTDAIHTYTVQKPAPVAAGPAEPAKGAGDYRILGALFPADEPSWFFKLTGPADAVADAEPAFDQFLASVRLPDPAKPPEYDLPAGWKSTGAGGIAADTIVLGPADKPLKLTVTGAKGGAKQNVERWAGQVGAPAGDDAAAKYTTPVDAKSGVKGLRVSVTGPKNPSGGMAPPFMGGGK